MYGRNRGQLACCVVLTTYWSRTARLGSRRSLCSALADFGFLPPQVPMAGSKAVGSDIPP